MKKYVVFDIDGVLAKVGDRVNYIQNKETVTPSDWDRFYNECFLDEPIKVNMELLRLFMCIPMYKTVLVTGRPEKIRQKTYDWFRSYGIHLEHSRVFMRNDDDHRPDYLFKRDIGIALDPEKILCVFEDRDCVVKMWRDLGVQCYQTCEGNY